MHYQAILELIQHVPALMVLAWLVWTNNQNTKTSTQLFVKELRATVERHNDTLAPISEACHKVQRDGIKAMNEVSRRVGENTQAFASLQLLLQRLNDRMVKESAE